MNVQHAVGVDFEESFKDIGIKVKADGAHIGEAAPEPESRPNPRSASWRAGTSEPELYFVVTVDDPTVRFWVGLVNEQTLFIAGLLLGAVMGAIASEWRNSRRVSLEA